MSIYKIMHYVQFNTQTVKENSDDVRHRMKDMVKKFAPEWIQRLNLGTQWNLHIVCIIVLNCAPPSCLTYQDKDDILQANKIDPRNPCIRLQTKTVVHSIFRERGNTQDDIDEANDSLVQSIALVEHSLIVPTTKESLNGDINNFCLRLGIEERFYNLLPTVLIAALGKFLAIQHGCPAHIVYGGEPSRDFRGTQVLTNDESNRCVVDCGSLPHPEACSNRSYLIQD